MKKIIIVSFLVVVVFSFLAIGTLLLQKADRAPVSRHNVFMMHFEPRSADEKGFQRFQERAVYAKEHNQKFSLGFTPQWVDMILADPAKLDFVKKLIAEGWDVAPQHHGAHHGLDWDGYCNFGAERCLKLRQTFYRGHPSPIMQWWYAEKERYNGDMKDYMTLMNKLYPVKVMAMGPDAVFDWPDSVKFSMDNAISKYESDPPVFDEPAGFENTETTGIANFTKKEYGGKIIYECGMRFISDKKALGDAIKDYETLQRNGKANEFMAAVIHIEDDERLFRDWIDYISVRDPEGKFNKTITELANDFSLRQEIR